jgi:hypothetical protein
VNKTGLLAVPNSGGWQTWRMVGKKDLSLNAGKQVMRVYREVNGADFNLNKLTFSRSTNSVTGDTSGYAARFDLFPAFPNPFNATTKISFEIPRTSEVDVTIYDVLGQEIKDLVDRRLEPGFYSEHWDGKNDNGMAIPSGVYFVRMQTDSFVRVRKLMLIK